MIEIDEPARVVLNDLYFKLAVNQEISISAPEYRQTQIDALVEAGLLKKIDASTLDGWAYIIKPTYAGENYVAQSKASKTSKINEFIRRGEEIGKIECHPAKNGFSISYVSGPLFETWMGEINIFNERYLKQHPTHDSIFSTYFHRKNRTSAYEDMMGHLRALAADTEFFSEEIVQTITNNKGRVMSNKVFIVHGHDEAAIQEMARTLEKGGYEAVILHEQPDIGLTIIEKIERYTDVDFAVVLYTECDLGRAKNAPEDDMKYRARQNVIFEHGYLIGKLGRSHVCALVKGNIETPGDINGVVYIPMDGYGGWKHQLANNMKAAGLPVDLNIFCS